VFGDTIVTKYEKEDDDGNKSEGSTETIGKYVGILDAKVYFRSPSGKLTEFNCDNVIGIFDDDMNPIAWDCNESSFVPKTLTELDIKNIQNKPIIGGTLIALGGALVFSTYVKECDDCTDANINTQKVSFLFIAVGGVLVALGI
jgi:hypothetical protein